jgi:hypothetical protein
MKPTPQINSKHLHGDSREPAKPRKFPSTDYNFQTTGEACGGVSAISQEKLRTFRKLSSEFFRAEIARDYAIELLLFALITGISAWPIMSALIAVTRLVRNY